MTKLVDEKLETTWKEELANNSTIETPIQDDKGQVVAKEMKTLVFAAPPAESKPTPIVEPQQDK